MIFMAEYISDAIRVDVCYHCTGNNMGRPKETEQWVKYFDTNGIMRSWECQDCKQLIADVDLLLLAKYVSPELLHT